MQEPSTEEMIERLLRAERAVSELRCAMAGIWHLDNLSLCAESTLEMTQRGIAFEVGLHEERWRWETFLKGQEAG